MLYIKPDYYDSFQCVADQCEDTCCAGWQIVVDENSLQKYKKENGPFKKQLHKGIIWKKKVFRQDKEKRCAFLNDENLCDMYIALGEKSLCRTCSSYPRHIEEFEGIRETTLSLSCPEVAKYLMKRITPVQLVYEETDEVETCEDFEEMDFDVLLYDILEEGRNVLIEILSDRNISLKIRCERALHMARELEDKISSGMAFESYEVFEKYKAKAESFSPKRLRLPMEYSQRVIGMIFRLERLRDDWEIMLSESASVLFLQGSDQYRKNTGEFEKWQRENMSLLIPMEHLIVYYVTTYFCGAVYDGEILAKVQSAVLWLYVIEELCKARWLINDGTFDHDDLYEIVYRFSRELEHSDKNIDRMEKMAKSALPVK